jgi:hypothetical protein
MAWRDMIRHDIHYHLDTITLLHNPYCLFNLSPLFTDLVLIIGTRPVKLLGGSSVWHAGRVACLGRASAPAGRRILEWAGRWHGAGHGWLQFAVIVLRMRLLEMPGVLACAVVIWKVHVRQRFYALAYVL